MRDFALFGWFVFNIAIPLLAPLALLPLIKIPRALRQRSRGVVMRAVQNGQLLWAAIPMSASACYLLAQHLGINDIRNQWMWTALTAHVALIVFAAVLVLLGAVEASLAAPGAAAPKWPLVLSLIVTAASAAAHYFGYTMLILPTLAQAAPLQTSLVHL